MAAVLSTTGAGGWVSVPYRGPLGPMTLAARYDPGRGRAGLAGVWFDGQRHDRAGLPPAAGGPEPAGQVSGLGSAPTAGGPELAGVLAHAAGWLDAYFRRAWQAPDEAGLVLAPVGTAFQREVWAALGEVPLGETTTYGALARTLAARTGRPVSARAVGGAVGRNPLSIVVPCHRVVGADGSLTGYAGGVERKRWLLEHEAAVPWVCVTGL